MKATVLAAVLAAVWHVPVPVPVIIAAAELAALAGLLAAAGLLALAVLAVRGFRSCPRPRPARPAPSGDAL
jgi:hypothetical protein